MTTVYTQLKTHLATQLTGILGTYTFPGNFTTPAIRIDDGAEREQPSVSGLECVIAMAPSDDAIETLDSTRLYSYRGNVHLFQWDPSKNARDSQDTLISALLSFNPTSGTFQAILAEIVGIPRAIEFSAIAEVRVPFRWFP